MVDETEMWKTHEYRIKLPLARALEVRDQLEEKVWEIADEEKEKKTLQDAQFEIQIPQPALDPVTVLVVIIGYVGMRVADKSTDAVIDKSWEVWKEKIWPKIKEIFGDDSLVDDD